MKICVVAPARNEGPYIVEWVAWYKMLGATDILVASNDCDDGSDLLLDILHAKGVIRHVRNLAPPGVPPLKLAHRIFHEDPVVRASDWVLRVDFDEFLVVKCAGGGIDDLIEQVGTNALAIAINWWNFGSSGHRRFNDCLVHEAFLLSSRPSFKQNRVIKSMFTRPAEYAGFRSHTPFGFFGKPSSKTRYVRSDGCVLPYFDPFAADLPKQVEAQDCCLERAHINHYSIRSAEYFSLKCQQLSGSALKPRYDEDHRKKFDRNTMTNLTALKQAGDFRPVHADLMSDPEVFRQHHLCCARTVEKICSLQGTQASEDQRYLMHAEKAGIS